MPELIEREALLESYDRAHKGPPGGARKLIAEAPAVEAEPVRRGRWIYRSDDGASCYCSECNEEALTAPYERNCIESDFCPCCGAKMDGKDINVITKDGGADNN